MVYVKLTNGFGNNLFQYIAGRLLAEHHKNELVLIPPFKNYYGLNEIIKLGLKFDAIENQIDLSSCELITEKNYLFAYKNNHNQTNLVLEGFFEDYTYYLDHIDTIKNIFPSIKQVEDNDLCFHFRTSDRLFMQEEFQFKPNAQKISNAIRNFDFERLHIISDRPFWKQVSAEDLNLINTGKSTFKWQNSQYDKNGNFIFGGARVDTNESAMYFNSVYEALEPYNPIFKKRSIADDFNFIRSSKNILFEHGTLAWWAAVLSDAKKVGVYGPWRSWKGRSNKNLSKIPLQNWFKWE